MTVSVQLRRAEPADAAFLHAVRAEPSAARFQPLRPYSERRLRALIEGRAAAPLDRHLDGKVQWVILADDLPAGWISLDVTSREHGIGSVGYTLSEAFQGRGIATSALGIVVGIAFAPSKLCLERLEAVAAVENIASRRVLEHAGFVYDGTARGLLRIGGRRVDHVRYGLLRIDQDAAHEPPGHRTIRRKEQAPA